MKKSILLTCFVISIFFNGCEVESIEKQVAKEAEKQYELSLKGGDLAEISVNAALVAEAYKQANDETNYLKWKNIAKEAEKKAMNSSIP